jgi:transposase
MREIINAIFHVLRGRVPWRMLPESSAPRQTVHGWLARWRDSGMWERMNHHLVMLDRERAGRDAGPTARLISCSAFRRCCQLCWW